MRSLNIEIGVSFLTPSGDLISQTSELRKSLLVERRDLAINVMNTVRKEHPEMITFQFEHLCTSVDVSTQEVQFQDHNNNTVKRNYWSNCWSRWSELSSQGSNGGTHRKPESFDHTQRSCLCMMSNLIVKTDEGRSLQRNFIFFVFFLVPNKYQKVIQPGVVTFDMNFRNLAISKRDNAWVSVDRPLGIGRQHRW